MWVDETQLSASETRRASCHWKMLTASCIGGCLLSRSPRTSVVGKKTFLPATPIHRTKWLRAHLTPILPASSTPAEADPVITLLYLNPSLILNESLQREGWLTVLPFPPFLRHSCELSLLTLGSVVTWVWIWMFSKGHVLKTWSLPEVLMEPSWGFR